MSDWRKMTTTKLIDDGILKIGDGYRAKNSELVSNGLPFARAGNINHGFRFVDADYLPSHYIETVGDKASLPGDTVFTSKGSVGRFGYVTNATTRFIYSPQICFWRSLNHEEILPRFIYYWMHGREFFEQVEVLKDQTDMADYVNLADQRKMTITLPPLPEQKAIAAVLSSLDDKIDLLHRQNKTLEAMAETLFRQWFVEEAKAEWTELPLSSIADFLNGLACQKYPQKNGIEKLPVLKIKELSSGISESTDRATSDVKSEYIVALGDVVFSWSGSLMVKVWGGENCVLNQHLFKVTSTSYPKWFYLLWCMHHLPEFTAIAKAHATTMGHIKKSDLDNAMVSVPSGKELLEMSAIMAPMLDKQIANYKQLTVLHKLRDTLLPKLISGEVRVDY